MSRIAEHYLGDYPAGAGFKEPTTSREAAEKINATLNERQLEVVLALDAAGPNGKTADEVAAVIGRDVLAVRPRLSELRAMRRIVPTGERRANKSRMKAKVWRLA